VRGTHETATKFVHSFSQLTLLLVSSHQSRSTIESVLNQDSPTETGLFFQSIIQCQSGYFS
jgi:hypothetical protein